MNFSLKNPDTLRIANFGAFLTKKNIIFLIEKLLQIYLFFLLLFYEKALKNN